MSNAEIPHETNRNEDKDTHCTPQYQFGGPVGVASIIVFFISLTYFTVEKCQSGRWDVLQIPRFPSTLAEYADVNVTIGVLTWLILQCVLYTLPVGGRVELGTLLKSCDKRLDYHLNALFVLLLNLFVLLAMSSSGINVTTLSSKLLQMTTSCVILSLLLSLILYIASYYVEKWKLNANGQTGNMFYDWFIGRELNPRIGSLDLKYVMFRSGITGWIILNTIFVLEAQGSITTVLCLIWLMHFIYVADYFWFEEGLIVSRDIVHEGLGFNISLQFVMIPFTFITQSRYLQVMTYSPSLTHMASVLLLYALGYYIYRASNSEKNNFRKNPNDKNLAHLKTMPTESGRKLLISGWWGLCRHPNYLGDLMISLSYALMTGFNHFLPYVNFLFLVMLLLDREQRDSDECQRKYGKDWNKYCQHVKYRIIPFVY
ncbi:hypothetical protein FSP39_018423 [Pinctada imbricata]|uniref:Uncharacterized protein n=1 Tax=Pinctada imbricata TaxID=66713 RepID=A0AA88Y710_PINIB|nr:hypothetical protein FSP39_018423 [Pinctada imbricata]